jgi:hypothetical protein
MKFKTIVACVAVAALALVAVAPLALSSVNASQPLVADGGGPKSTTGG